MPVRLRLSAAARDDLRDIRNYSKSAFEAAVAAAYLAGLRRMFGTLRENPLAGPLARNAREGIRSIGYRSHRLYYRVDGELLLVIRIIHHARDAPRLIS